MLRRGKGGKKNQKITDVEIGEVSPTPSSLSMAEESAWGAGISSINSNINLYTAIQASQYNAMYMYICIYILGMC